MQNKIKEVQDYFKNKILTGDFEITEIENYSMVLKVDKIYEFVFWTGNVDIPESRKQYEFNFMDLDLTEEDHFAIDVILQPSIQDYRRNELYNQKVLELENLKAELGING